MARSSTWCSLRALGPTKRCAIVYRSGGLCAWCERALLPREVQLDHVVPRRDGGSDTPDNLVVACARCQIDRPDSDVAWARVTAQLDTPLDFVAGRMLADHMYPWARQRTADNKAYLKRRDTRRRSVLTVVPF